MAAPNTPQFFNDLLDLVEYYNRFPKVKAFIDARINDPNLTWRGVKLKTYIVALVRLSARFKKEYEQDLREVSKKEGVIPRLLETAFKPENRRLIQLAANPAPTTIPEAIQPSPIQQPPTPPKQMITQQSSILQSIKSAPQAPQSKQELYYQLEQQTTVASRATFGLNPLSTVAPARLVTTAAPISWIVIGLLSLFFILPVLMQLFNTTSLFPPFDQFTATTGEAADLLVVKKTGIPQVDKKGQIDYKVSVTYKGSGSATVKITDTLPAGEIYKNSDINSLCGNPTATAVAGGQIITWTLSGIPQNSPKVVCLSALAPDADTYVTNQVKAEVVTTTATGNLKLLQSGPTDIADTNTPITYSLAISYTGSGSITFDITDNLSALLGEADTGATGSCNSSMTGNYNPSTNLVSWQNLTLKTGENKTLCLTAKAKPNTSSQKIDNTFKAKITKVEQVPATGSTISSQEPNDSTCSGVYAAPNLYSIDKNPLGKNFGDPGCNFSKPTLAELLRTQDPKDGAFFYWLVEYESSYIPNAYTSFSPAKGAWGLYQMGTVRSGDIYDRGDVVWQLQTANAVNLKNQNEHQTPGWLRSEGSYWEVARPSYCQKFPGRCNARP